jgi:hypothetical protein
MRRRIEPDILSALTTRALALASRATSRAVHPAAPRRRSRRPTCAATERAERVLEHDLHVAAERPHRLEAQALDVGLPRTRSARRRRSAAAARGPAWSCPSRIRRRRRASRPCAPRADAVDRLDVADRARSRPRLIGNQTFRSSASITTGAPPARRRRIGLRLGGEQRAGVGMLRRGEDLARPALLDDLALGHHADPVGDLAHDAEVVGDEQHRHAEPRLQVRSSFRICACTVTSSAVVGSSAISRSGSLASAIAIITRWRWPPESWCG